MTVDADGTISAGLEIAVEEKDALAALSEGMRNAEALAAKKKNW